MTSYSKKIFIASAVGILLIAGAFIASQDNEMFFSFLSRGPQDDADFIRFSPPDPEIKAHDWDRVGVYENPVYHYRVEYPATNFTIDPDVSKKDPSNIVFWSSPGLDDSRHFTFYASATNEVDPRRIAERYIGQFVFEKDIVIDGVPAVVVHWVEDGREYPEAKVVFFIKNGYEYHIWTEYIDHERVWRSFRFTE